MGGRGVFDIFETELVFKEGLLLSIDKSVNEVSEVLYFHHAQLCSRCFPFTLLSFIESVLSPSVSPSAHERRPLRMIQAEKFILDRL